MGKTKTPFLSLGAHGTLGNVLTAQKRGRKTLLREKPTPVYSRTLAQNYHRWDYQDQVYLWTLLSEAEKRTYKTAGAKYHMPGLAYWMKGRLLTLPDLLMRLHLDEPSGNIAYDSSKQGNNGTIYGATPATGVIAGCRSFDGIDDYIAVPDAPSLNPTKYITILFWMYSNGTQNAWTTLFNKSRWQQWRATYDGTGNYISFTAWIDGVRRDTTYKLVTHNTWHRLECCFDGTYLYFYCDTILLSKRGPYPGTLDTTTADLEIGRHWHTPAFRCFDGLIDDFIILDRLLDPTQRQRDYERSYPL